MRIDDRLVQARDVVLPEIAPPWDGAAGALRAARSRVLRRRLVASVVALACCAGLVVVRAASHVDSLEVVDRPGLPSPSPSRESAIQLAQRRASNPPPGVRPVAPRPPKSTGDTDGPGGDAIGSRRPAAVVSPGEVPAGEGRARRTSVRHDASAPCDVDAAAAAAGWCLRYLSAAQSPAGRAFDVVFEICRPAAFGAARLDFAGAHEVAVEIWDAEDGEVRGLAWQSRRSTVAGRPHAVTVRAAECMRWTQPWAGRRADGTLARPGDYLVTVRVAASSPAGPPQTSYTPHELALT